MGCVHSHVINFKIDIDGMVSSLPKHDILGFHAVFVVAGVANSVQTNEVVVEEGKKSLFF